MQTSNITAILTQMRDKILAQAYVRKGRSHLAELDIDGREV